MANQDKRRDSGEPSSNAEGQTTKIVGTSGDLRTTTKAASGSVIIGCKIPNGIIMQNSRPERTSEPVMGGGHRDVTVGRKHGDKYVVKGPAVPVGQIPKFLIAGGYALTSGIPREFAEQWFEQNKDADIVKNELIIMHESVEDVEAHALQNESLKTGLEPIDPAHLPRGVQTAEEQGGRIAR